MNPIDRRQGWLRLWAMCDARQIVKDRLKAQNKRPCQFAQSEITLMAQEYLQQAGNWPRLRDQALAKILGDAKLRREWDREGQKYEAQMAKQERPVCVLPRLSV
jgi:hypothetical protein